MPRTRQEMKSPKHSHRSEHKEEKEKGPHQVKIMSRKHIFTCL